MAERPILRAPSRAQRPAVRCGPGGRVETMRRHQRVTASSVRRPQSERLRRRQRWYFALMATCLVLIMLAWNVVRLWSTTAAVVMSVVAAVLPLLPFGSPSGNPSVRWERYARPL